MLTWILLVMFQGVAGDCDQDHFGVVSRAMTLAQDLYGEAQERSPYAYFNNLTLMLMTPGKEEKDFFAQTIEAIIKHNLAFFENCFHGLAVTVLLFFFSQTIMTPNQFEHYHLVSMVMDLTQAMFHSVAQAAERSPAHPVLDSDSQSLDFLLWQYTVSIQQRAAFADLSRPVYLDEMSTFASLIAKGGRQRHRQEILRPTDLPSVSKLICLEYFCEPAVELFQSVLVSGILPHLGAIAILSADEQVLSRMQGQVGHLPVHKSCNESNLPYILGPADGWRLLPLHVSRMLLILAAAVEALLTSSVSAVSMRHHVLDAASNTNHLQLLLSHRENAFSLANLFPIYGEADDTEHDSLVLLSPRGRRPNEGYLWGKSNKARLDQLLRAFRVAGYVGELPNTDDLNVFISKCGQQQCFSVGHHALPELPLQDVYLFRREDSFAPPGEHCQRINALDFHHYKGRLASGFGLTEAPKKYDFLALASEGLFTHQHNEIFAKAFFMPVASLIEVKQRPVQFIPVDFFGPCREQHGWLLVDLIQSLHLFLLQGLGKVTVIEPLLAHVPHDMRCLNKYWMSTPELMGELVETTWEQMQSVPFRDFFDIGHFRSELQKFSVHETVPWHEFQQSEAVIDTLFLLNDVALRGGLRTLGDVELEPILRCQDQLDFNQEIGIYNDSKVFVRRLICLQGAHATLDMVKFETEVRKVLEEPSDGSVHRMGFQLYNWDGLERMHLQGMDLGQAVQVRLLPSMWNALRFSPSLLWLADRVVQRMTNGSFTAAHLRWRTFQDEGDVGYKHPNAQRQKAHKFAASLTLPEHYVPILQLFVPKSLRCGDVFLMTNLPPHSELLEDLRSAYFEACGQAHRLHSITDELLPPSDIRDFFETPRAGYQPQGGHVWSGLHGFFLEVAIATRANFFVGYGASLGSSASAVSKIVVKLRAADGRGYWCNSWAFDPYCAPEHLEMPPSKLGSYAC